MILWRNREITTMTYQTTSHVPAGNGALTGLFLTHLSGFFANLTKGMRAARLENDIRTQLEAMTDRELADIGIARFMIDDIAAKAAADA